jgi:peptidoglycan/LPS O-acetylase OafA/YrhL
MGGGWIGVDLFFVLSGFLITGQLMRDDWSLLEFFWRRLARLWPTLLLLCATLATIAPFAGVEWSAIATAATYTRTPALLVHDTGEPFLGHTWTLAVEMQFYVAAALVLLKRRNRDPRRVLIGATVLAVMSYALMAALILGGHTHFAYDATVTRSCGLFVGCAIAATPLPWRIARPLFWACIPLVVAAVLFGGQLDGFRLVLIPPMLALTAAAVSVAVVKPQWGVIRALSVPTMEWLGVRSYSLYLWHFPIFHLIYSNPWTAAPLSIALMWGASVAVASLSYQFLEVPSRRWLGAHRPGWALGRSPEVTELAPTAAAR